MSTPQTSNSDNLIETPGNLALVETGPYTHLDSYSLAESMAKLAISGARHYATGPTVELPTGTLAYTPLDSDNIRNDHMNKVTIERPHEVASLSKVC